MKRSGGKPGRPMAHLSIVELEKHAHANERDVEELEMVRNELGYRKTARATELKELVLRLIRNPSP
jgi:hypothetical protein